MPQDLFRVLAEEALAGFVAKDDVPLRVRHGAADAQLIQDRQHVIAAFLQLRDHVRDLRLGLLALGDIADLPLGDRGAFIEPHRIGRLWQVIVRTRIQHGVQVLRLVA